MMLPLLSGGGWGSLLMLPSLFVPPYLAWRLRPTGKTGDRHAIRVAHSLRPYE